MPASKVMHEFKEGNLHSGKGGPIVKSRKQAIAIYLSERRKEGGSAPMKGKKSPMAEHINKLKAKGKLKGKKSKVLLT